MKSLTLALQIQRNPEQGPWDTHASPLLPRVSSGSPACVHDCFSEPVCSVVQRQEALSSVINRRSVEGRALYLLLLFNFNQGFLFSALTAPFPRVLVRVQRRWGCCGRTPRTGREVVTRGSLRQGTSPAEATEEGVSAERLPACLRTSDFQSFALLALNCSRSKVRISVGHLPHPPRRLLELCPCHQPAQQSSWSSRLEQKCTCRPWTRCSCYAWQRRVGCGPGAEQRVCRSPFQHPDHKAAQPWGTGLS